MLRLPKRSGGQPEERGGKRRRNGEKRLKKKQRRMDLEVWIAPKIVAARTEITRVQKRVSVMTYNRQYKALLPSKAFQKLMERWMSWTKTKTEVAEFKTIYYSEFNALFGSHLGHMPL
mmetsp:Transcript_2615/g.3930  ORF Transcript_2615/g.3930 Transcript_2615/m.3930 type:complete len:118 (-) Transcript_2615:142-495(-)